MKQKHSHMMVLIGLCILTCSDRTGQVSAVDDSHLSFLGH